jgi:hypothetical protein
MATHKDLPKKTTKERDHKATKDLIDDDESEMESEVEDSNGNTAAVLEPTADNIAFFGTGIDRETVMSQTVAKGNTLYQKLLKGAKRTPPPG